MIIRSFVLRAKINVYYQFSKRFLKILTLKKTQIPWRNPQKAVRTPQLFKPENADGVADRALYKFEEALTT